LLVYFEEWPVLIHHVTEYLTAPRRLSSPPLFFIFSFLRNFSLNQKSAAAAKTVTNKVPQNNASQKAPACVIG